MHRKTTRSLLGPTLLAGYVSWLVFIGITGILYGMLPWLAGQLGLRPMAGFVGGLVGALIPRFPGFAEPLTAVCIGLMQAAFLRRCASAPVAPRSSLLLGLAIGLSFLAAPTLLPVALGLLAFELHWRPEPRRWRGAALVLLGMALGCAPWTWRNYKALGGLFFIRSNFGLELRMGNHEGAGANLDLSARGGTERHPRSHEEEARKVQRLGELEYMRQTGREAMAWIRSHPWGFARLTGLRAWQFWFGPIDDRVLALGISVLTILAVLGAGLSLGGLSPPQRAVLLIPLVTYPLVHYIVGFEARYRLPLDGLALLLAGSFLVRVSRDKSVADQV